MRQRFLNFLFYALSLLAFGIAMLQIILSDIKERAPIDSTKIEGER